MKKRSFVLAGLIGLALIAMFLPWAYLWAEYTNGPNSPMCYYPKFGLYALGAPVGNLYSTFSFFLALAAFVFSFFSGKRPACRTLCGGLLLGSAGFCFYEGYPSFHCFTALTWCIFGALVLLGLWTLFFFKTDKRSVES